LYVPEHFTPTEEQVRELLREHGAVDLVTATPNGLRATMLPMVWIESENVLLGHFARKNDHWQQPVIGQAMAIMRGPDAYITPTWYETKREHGRVVPTWNYITAHIYGELVVHDDAAFVERNVRALTDKHEGHRDPSWAVDDAPASYIEGQLKAIVGVELRISRVSAKFKLSQNRSAEDVAGVIDGLATEGGRAMSDAVRASEESRVRR
jgi:transcriptional regulator